MGGGGPQPCDAQISASDSVKVALGGRNMLAEAQRVLQIRCDLPTQGILCMLWADLSSAEGSTHERAQSMACFEAAHLCFVLGRAPALKQISGHERNGSFRPHHIQRLPP